MSILCWCSTLVLTVARSARSARRSGASNAAGKRSESATTGRGTPSRKFTGNGRSHLDIFHSRGERPGTLAVCLTRDRGGENHTRGASKLHAACVPR